MEVFFPEDSRYPLAEPPLIGVRGPALTPLGRRSLAGALAAHALELAGEPSIYSLALWLETHLPAVMESGMAAERAQAGPRRNRRDQGAHLSVSQRARSAPAERGALVTCM